MKYKIINFNKIIQQKKGYLSFFETNKDVEFDIKRIYYIYEVPQGESRGYHAHKNLKQILFCPFGRIDIGLDDGINKITISLDDPAKGLIINEGVWRTMEFIDENSILCVAASEYYDEYDYIRDYNEFINMVKAGYWNESRI